MKARLGDRLKARVYEMLYQFPKIRLHIDLRVSASPRQSSVANLNENGIRSLEDFLDEYSPLYTEDSTVAPAGSSD